MSDVTPVTPAPKYSALKGAWKGVKTAALVAGPLVLQYLAADEHAAGVLPPKYAGLAGVLAGLARFLLNRQKHA